VQSALPTKILVSAASFYNWINAAVMFVTNGERVSGRAFSLSRQRAITLRQ
jgi:hypothetical protein